MTVEIVLISLQSLFLSLFGMHGIKPMIAAERKRGLLVLLTLVPIILISILFTSLLRSNIQLVLLVLLGSDYLLSFQDSQRRGRMIVAGAIIVLAYALLYFQWDSWLIWIGAPVFWGLLAIVIKRWPRSAPGMDYLFKAGALLTLLFLLEPVIISIQQNLKPIATIPIASIINSQTFLSLGGLLLLTIAGFFWKEKSRL